MDRKEIKKLQESIDKLIEIEGALAHGSDFDFKEIMKVRFKLNSILERQWKNIRRYCNIK